MTVDAAQQRLEAFVGRGFTELFTQPHGAQLGRIDGFDQVAKGQHDFRAAAADVHHGHVLIRQIECPLHAGKREQGFLLGADDFDVDAQLLAGPAAELFAVGRLAHRAAWRSSSLP